MGCYGIGISRLVGILVENSVSDYGCIAPFKETIVSIGNDSEVLELSSKIFESSKECIWDDRDASYGQKCAEADLIGSPIQFHIGKKELESNKVIIKKNGIKQEISVEEMYNLYLQDK
jgi:prolyl-tRNA synthetase